MQCEECVVEVFAVEGVCRGGIVQWMEFAVEGVCSGGSLQWRESAVEGVCSKGSV